MHTYCVKIVYILVYEWDSEDGQGDYVCTKDGYILDNVSDLSEARDAIEEFLGYNLYDHNYQDDCIMACIVEDGKAERCTDGDYIAEYCFSIEENRLVTFTGKI